MTNGSDGEREVANRLEDDHDYRTLRAPSSGGGTARERPDVLAGKDGHILALEVKTSSGDPVYVEKTEVQALREYADGFGAEPYIAVRWKSRSLRDTTIYVSQPAEMHETAKSYRAKYETCQADWPSLTDITR